MTVLISYRFKRRIIIHKDKEILKNAVINNLVPEEKREVLFSTHFPEEEDHNETELFDSSRDEIKVLEERIDKLEKILKKIIDFIIKSPSRGSEARSPE